MITLEYFAQAKMAAGCEREEFDSAQVDRLDSLIEQTCARHGDSLSTILLHEGMLAPWILVAINGVASTDRATTLEDGDVVRLVSPISGG